MWWHTIKEREQDVKKDELLKLCFFTLLKLGLENTTMRDFSDATNMNASNLYYWFKDKDMIIQGAAEWGLINCTKLIFDCAYKHIGNLDELCQRLPDMVWKQRFELRFIFQIATSPYYGEHMNKHGEMTVCNVNNDVMEIFEVTGFSDILNIEER